MPLPLILLTLPPPLNTQPRPIETPLPLVCWRLSSRLPLVRQLVVALPVVPCLRLASPFVTQPPHTSILNPSSLFASAGCCVASLCTASASRRAATSPLAVSSPLPMSRCSCHQFAGVFAVIAIAIVTLVARRRAGSLVVVVIDVHRHCRDRRPSRRRHRHR